MKPLKPCEIRLQGGPADGSVIAWQTTTGNPPIDWLVPELADMSYLVDPSADIVPMVARYRLVRVSWFPSDGLAARPPAVGFYVYKGSEPL